MVTVSGQRESGGPGKIVSKVLHGGIVVARGVARTGDGSKLMVEL